jgi:hypothetical protein
VLIIFVELPDVDDLLELGWHPLAVTGSSPIIHSGAVQAGSHAVPKRRDPGSRTAAEAPVGLTSP